MAFVLVQHLDPHHASMLPQIVSRLTTMPVVEVSDGMAIEPNRVHIVPPGMTLSIEARVLRLAPRSAARSPHRPIDDFLRSLAESHGHQSIGVILSGTATDGTLGLEAVKAEGGITFAQDASAQHDGMPRSATATGCVDFVLPPEDIAVEIARIGRHPCVGRTGDVGPEPTPAESSIAPVLEQIRLATGVDFSHYKRNTLYRRIARRVVLHKRDSLEDYVHLLRGNAAEAEALYRDILISITSFFRDPEAFELLKTRVFPQLTRERSRHEAVRIWVLGCSTGEEVYSVAMAFTEFCESVGRQIPVQIFATDLNGAALERARAGVFSKNAVQDMSPERLLRFFVEVDGSYRVNKSIRDVCVFAQHNVLTEPPFSRIDLLSCRNLLIYLEPSLQQRVLPILHYALRPTGFLWLGSSETIGSSGDLFEVADARNKLYTRKPAPSRLTFAFPSRDHGPDARAPGQPAPLGEIAMGGAEAQREADRILLARYAPPGVLVSGGLEILQFRGETGHYLAPAPGKASLNLLKMLREGLLVGVRGAILKARREEAPVREEGLRVRSNGGYRDVTVQVIPLRGASAGEGCFLVLFEEAAAAASGRTPEAPAETPPRGESEPEATNREVVGLKQELAATREYLQSAIEQQQAANEELQSANEEVQAANEELQSVNEELETSKEELQSSNEELATVNEELHNRNLELSLSNNDLLNLFGSVEIPIVILSHDFRIRRFTPAAEKLFNLIGTDVGRPINDIQINVSVPDLDQLLGEVLETATVKEREVQGRNGRWYSMRLWPYRTMENRIDGVVLLLVDVDAIKRQQEALALQAELLDQTLEPIFVWKLAGPIVYWNAGAETAYGFTRAEALGRSSHELLGSSTSAGAIRDALRRDGQWTGEVVHTRRDGHRIVVESRMVLVHEDLVLETDHPITERKQLEEALRQRADELLAADRAKNEFIAMLAHELRNPLAPMRNALHVSKNQSADEPTLSRARDMMERQIQNMARMIDDLLDVSRMTQGRIRLRREPLTLAEPIERAVELTRHHIDAREQALAVSFPPGPVWVDGDAVRLEQVFGNLLNNASKFTDRRGHIWVSVARSEPGEVTVRVRDDGIGVDGDVLPRVFEPFVQADRSVERVHGGLGIGLTLVRHIVELHGGTVEARSPGSGFGFEVVMRLPVLAAAPEATTEPRPETPVGVAPLRILVVDDNADAADSLATVLRLAGHTVEVGYDGPSALARAARFDPHVVVLDIGLPGTDGYETARRLRRLDRTPPALLIAVTGYGQDADRRLAQEAGFDLHFTKPIDPLALRDSLPHLYPPR